MSNNLLFFKLIISKLLNNLLKLSSGPPTEEIPQDFKIISPPRKTPPEGMFQSWKLINEVKW